MRHGTSGAENTARTRRGWDALSPAMVSARAAHLLGASARPQAVAEPPVSSVVHGDDDDAEPRTAKATRTETDSVVAPSTHLPSPLPQEPKGAVEARRVRLGALFAPSRVLSTGSIDLDRAFFNAGNRRTGPSVRRARAVGGLTVGRLYELYGPPLCGKTRFLQNLLATHARHMFTMHGTAPHAREQTTPSAGPTRAESPLALTCVPSPWLPLHPDSWDIIVCLTTPMPTRASPSEVDVCLSDWTSSFLRLLKRPEPSTGHNKARRPRCAEGSADDLREGGGDVEVGLLQACATHIHLLPVSEPNALLACLDHVHQSLRASTSSSSATVHNVLIVVDSLEVIWRHTSLQANAMAHASHWYAVELHRRLRLCLACDLGASTGNGTSEATAALRHVTCVALNSCAYFDLQRISPGSAASASSPALAAAPRPLGGVHWEQAVECRLLLEPTTVDMMGLVAHPSRRGEPTGAVTSCAAPTSSFSSPASAVCADLAGSKRHRPERVEADGRVGCVGEITEEDGPERKKTLHSRLTLTLPVRCTVVNGTCDELHVDCMLWQK